MNHYRTFFVITLIATLFIFAAASTALAACSSSPSQPPGEPPYGLNVEGSAAGTKLKGVIEISFTNIQCDAIYETIYGSCDITGPNAAWARVALRLSEPNINAEDSTKAFYVDIGTVPILDIPAVQSIVMEAMRSFILTDFFEGDTGQEIYLKEFSLYTLANISTADPEARDVEFTAIADLTLAID